MQTNLGTKEKEEEEEGGGIFSSKRGHRPNLISHEDSEAEEAKVLLSLLKEQIWTRITWKAQQQTEQNNNFLEYDWSIPPLTLAFNRTLVIGLLAEPIRELSWIQIT